MNEILKCVFVSFFVSNVCFVGFMNGGCLVAWNPTQKIENPGFAMNEKLQLRTFFCDYVCVF